MTKRECPLVVIGVGLMLIVMGTLIGIAELRQDNDRLRHDLQSAERRIRVLEADLSATLRMVNR